MGDCHKECGLVSNTLNNVPVFFTKYNVNYSGWNIEFLRKESIKEKGSKSMSYKGRGGSHKKCVLDSVYKAEEGEFHK